MSEQPLTCAYHPKRETTLRCNRCGKPICSQCAVQTPVGYRCKECILGQQRNYETARNYDFLIAGAVAAFGAGVSIALLGFLGFWGFLLAPIVGGGLARAVQWAVGRRRSRNLPLATAIGGVIGTLPHVAGPILIAMTAVAGQGGSRLLGNAAISLLWPLAYAALIISSMYASLRGIRL
jgi:hypothetical protein